MLIMSCIKSCENRYIYTFVHILPLIYIISLRNNSSVLHISTDIWDPNKANKAVTVEYVKKIDDTCLCNWWSLKVKRFWYRIFISKISFILERPSRQSLEYPGLNRFV